MIKFNRNYILEIEGGDGNLITIDSSKSPLTLEFSVHEELLSSVNAGTLRIYNLSENTRRSIYHDCYDYENVRFVRLRAGYGDKLSTILYGNISEASSFRSEGAVNFVTEMRTFDWGHAFTNSSTNRVLYPSKQPDGGTYVPQGQVIDGIITDLAHSNPSGANVVKGYVSPQFNTKYPRAQSLSGNSWDLLKQKTNDHCFIINGVVHCLLDDECFQSTDILTVSEESGLLGTPRKSDQLLTFDMLFEPSIAAGQMIKLISKSDKMYNTGVNDSSSTSPFYKIFRLEHSGIISGAVNGRCRTTVSVNAGIFRLNPVTGVFVDSPATVLGAQ